jgi:hypothetical protein
MEDKRHVDVAKVCGSNKELISKFYLLSLLLSLILIIAACGGPSQTAGSSASASTPAGQLRISLPPAQATVGVPYNAVPSVSGGATPYLFGITDGNLPPGLALNSATGSITGTPTVVGTYNFLMNVSTIQATGLDSTPPGRESSSGPPAKQYGSSSAHIVVAASGAGGLSISPSSVTVVSQGQQQFTAQMSGTANTAVTWSTDVGTVSSSGAFVAPTVTSNTPATITATSTSNPSVHAAATVTVTPLGALTITNGALPNGNINTPYAATLSATGGVSPYQWSLASGTLPSGIQLQPSSGVITGMTAFAGSYPITAKVTDLSGHSASLPLTLTLSSGSASGFDGPAELPRVYIQTAMSNTPAPGSTISVSSGGNLQSALNSASCGDTIELQAGATFTGIFTFPAKSCDDNHWIIVRTNAADSALPAEGSRLTPCYAGVASLPGRPALQCASTKNVVAKLVMAEGGSGPVVFAAGANYYRLTGLEITRLTGTGVVYGLASLASGATASNIILDRVWMHGTAQDETTRGVDLGASTYFSVIDSYFTDFHCISITGSCTDSQTINGGLGDNPMGPYKIVDNFLEAAGENILFGGGAATASPADIEISRNHMFKPLTWMKGQSGYVGGSNGNPFGVKNHLELKNAQRVLADSNIMEDSWGGFSQVGFSILLTPKNQAGANNTNLCPSCQVTDVTIRYDTISHVAAGMQIGNGQSDNGGLAQDGERYSIHDVIVDDIDGVKYGGPGQFAQVSTGPGAALLQNVTINHVTAFSPSTLLLVGDEVAISSPMKNFIFTNSIVNAGPYPVWSTGTGGTANCAVHDSPLTTFNACFTSYSFAANAVIASPSGYPASTWPSGNFFPASATTVQFVNYNGANGGNYLLQPSSPYKGMGTDGKDVGADVNAVDAAIAGVE